MKPVRIARPAQLDRALKPAEASVRAWHLRLAASVPRDLPEALVGVLRGEAWYRWRRDSGELDLWCAEEPDFLNAQGVAGDHLVQAERRAHWYVFEE